MPYSDPRKLEQVDYIVAVTRLNPDLGDIVEM
jgi:hypothetical protein